MADGRTTSGNSRSNKRKQNDSSSDEVSADYGPSIWSDIFEDDSDGREEIERMAELSVHDLRRAKRLKHTLPPLPTKQDLIAKKKASSWKDRRLRKEMEAAEEMEWVIRSRLIKELEVSRVSGGRDVTRIPEMNYWRNYKAHENFRNAASEYSKPVNTYDPFSRRSWTRS